MVRKKFKLKNHEILLVETLIFHNSRTKIFPDMLFLQFFLNWDSLHTRLKEAQSYKKKKHKKIKAFTKSV